MRENLKAELDLLLQKKNKNGLERRRDPRLRDFDAHLQVLHSFASVQNDVIRPAMTAFGKYLESFGHRYFIGTREEFVDGHNLPISTVTLHLLLNDPGNAAVNSYPSLTFKADHTRVVYAIKKTDAFTSSAGSCALDAVTAGFVETKLKDFVVETLTSVAI